MLNSRFSTDLECSRMVHHSTYNRYITTDDDASERVSDRGGEDSFANDKLYTCFIRIYCNLRTGNLGVGTKGTSFLRCDHFIHYSRLYVSTYVEFF